MAQSFPSDPNIDPGVGGISTVGSNTYRWTGESWIGYSPDQTLQEVLFAGNSADIGLSVVGVITANAFNVSTGSSTQFLKADGTLDNGSYIPSNMIQMVELP